MHTLICKDFFSSHMHDYLGIVFQISQLESALSQEQAMHIVARTQLSSIEDENQRLRTQLNNMRRRYTHGATEER